MNWVHRSNWTGVLIVVLFTLLMFSLSGCGSSEKTETAVTENQATEQVQADPSSSDKTDPSAITETENTDVNSGEAEQEIEIKKMTLKEAYQILCENTGVDDLNLYSYTGFYVDIEGKSDNFSIVGYSSSNQSTYQFAIRSGTVKFKEYNTVDPVEDTNLHEIDAFKDSPQLVQEAVGKLGKWPDEGGSISLLIEKPEVEVGALKTGYGLVKLTYVK